MLMYLYMIYSTKLIEYQRNLSNLLIKDQQVRLVKLLNCTKAGGIE